MEQNETTRERIVKTAEALHDEGRTWNEVADKLEIGTSTLRKYRNNDEYKRGGSKSVGNKVEKKMNKGGRLTQLENNYRKGKGGRKPPPPPPGEPQNFSDLTGIDRPTLPTNALDRVREEDFPALSEAIDNGDTMRVIAYRNEIREGEEMWTVGKPSEIHETIEERTLEFDLAFYLDDVELTNIMYQKFWDENIIYPDD